MSNEIGRQMEIDLQVTGKQKRVVGGIAGADQCVEAPVENRFGFRHVEHLELSRSHIRFPFEPQWLRVELWSAAAAIAITHPRGA